MQVSVYLYLRRVVMSLRKLSLLLTLTLMVPASALADGVDFGWSGGAMDSSGAFLTNNPSLSGGFGSPSALNFVQREPQSTIPSTITGANIGSVILTTGNFISYDSNTFTYTFSSVGSSLVITANSNFGNGVPAGSVLFSGNFTGTITLTQTGCFTFTGCNIPFQLSGTIAGTLGQDLMNLFGLGNSSNASGWVMQTQLVFASETDPMSFIQQGDASVVVPEPGTLALFGTGLLSVAGILRRRIAA